MQAPAEYGGIQLHNRWTYTAIVEPSQIEFVSTFADSEGNAIEPATAGIPAGVPTEVPHLVELEALPDGCTRVTVTETGYSSEDARSQSQGGREQCLDKMRALFAGVASKQQ